MVRLEQEAFGRRWSRWMVGDGRSKRLTSRCEARNDRRDEATARSVPPATGTGARGWAAVKLARHLAVQSSRGCRRAQLASQRPRQHSLRRVCPMLYLLLFPLHVHYVGFNVLRYETFARCWRVSRRWRCHWRSGPLLIQRFRAAHIGQTIREEVPQTHQKKAGTPTMGGLLILASCIIATILLADPAQSLRLDRDLVTLAFGAIGFTDDLLKLRRGQGPGPERSAQADVAVRLRLRRGGGAVRFVLRFDTHSDGAIFQEPASEPSAVALHAVRDVRDGRRVPTRST